MTVSKGAQFQEIEAYEALFGTLGWKLLTDEMAGWTTRILSGLVTVSPDKLGFHQGRYDGIKQIADFPTFVAQWREMLEAPEVEEGNPLEDHY